MLLEIPSTEGKIGVLRIHVTGHSAIFYFAIGQKALDFGCYGIARVDGTEFRTCNLQCTQLPYITGSGSSPGSGALGFSRVFCIAQPSMAQIGSKSGEVFSIYSRFLKQVAKAPSWVVFELTKQTIYCRSIGFEGCCFREYCHQIDLITPMG